MGECAVNPTTCSVLGGSVDNSSSGSHNGLFSAGRSSNHGDGVNGRGKNSVNKRRRRGDLCVSRYRRRSKRKRFFERGSLARDIERGAISTEAAVSNCIDRVEPRRFLYDMEIHIHSTVIHAYQLKLLAHCQCTILPVARRTFHCTTIKTERFFMFIL